MTNPILACRPVEWPQDGPMANTEPTLIYPDSIIQSCAGCGTDVYVGPRMQAVQKEHDLPVHCFLCGMVLADPTSTVQDLGNPYQPEGPS